MMRKSNTTLPRVKSSKKRAISAPGRKLGFREALEQTNRKFGKALAKLAK
jgi:hypothetical protein